MPPINLIGPDTGRMWGMQCLQAGLRDGAHSSYLIDPSGPDTYDLIKNKADAFRRDLTLNGIPQEHILSISTLYAPGRIGNLTLAYLYGFAFGQGTSTVVASVHAAGDQPMLKE